MKESEIIKKKIENLIFEKEDLTNKIKPVPQFDYKNKFIGISLSNGKEKYIKVLEHKEESITKEKLNELRATAIKENEPHINRIKEIDEIIPELKKKLVEVKAKEILETPNNKNESEIDEGKLISSLLDVVLGNDLKKYSLRKLESSLGKIGFNIDHNSLQKKFNNQSFQLFLIAGIMRKKDQVRKEVEKDKLQSFEKWFNTSYMKVKGANRKPEINAYEGKEETNDFIDNINLDL